MGFSLKTHETKVQGGTLVLSKVRPYIRIHAGEGEPIVFIQDGEFWSEGGQAIEKKQLNDKFWAEVKKLSPDVRKSVGLDAASS